MTKKGLLSGFTLLILSSISFAQDWNQWRGANRDGAVFGFTVPKTLPEQLKLKWKIDVGIGHSTPVISGNRVFLMSRQSEQEIIACYDLETGKQLWKDGYPAA